MPVHRHSIAVGPPETEATGPAAIAVGAYETYSFFYRTLSHLMFGSVFQRFPKLQFVMTEIGCTWVPQELHRLDWSVKLGRTKGEIAYPLYHRTVETMDRLPSEYWHSNMHIAPSLLVRKDLEVRHDLGIDRIMWGADYPHHEGSFPYNKLAMRLLFSDVPEAEVRAMTSLNAAKLYGFDLDKLQKIADRVGPTVEEVATPVSPDELPKVSFSHTVGDAIVRNRALAA
jgi:predicted TIM-barrel fold metal-dependent hydrolase